MTKLDESRLLKKEASETAAIIDELGQDSEDRGAKAILKFGKEEQVKEKKKEEDLLNKLDMERNRKEAYYRSILVEARLRMTEFDPPIGFKWTVKISSDGLALYIKDPAGQQYGKGMKVLGQPVHDARGIDALITKALDYMDLISAKWTIQAK